jgi:hypothetical protein
MRSLADNGGYALVEDGPRLLFFQRRILPSWLPFVCGLLALITLGNGLVQLVLGHPAPGAILLGVGAASVLALHAVQTRRRAVRLAPLDPGQALVVIDLEHRVLRNGRGDELAALETVRVERTMQLTSSARAVRVVWPGGTVMVYRGDPLTPGGSIEAAVEALRERGISS